MSRARRALSIAAVITIIEIVVWMAARSGIQVWHEWHRAGGMRVLSAVGLAGTVSVAVIVVWLVILMARP